MRPAPSTEKLENRLAADPASKVFVPLAEEYRKAGEIDRAVELLRSGLEKNPDYAAAEVALARALLQKDEREECRRILTRVTRRVPDNLLAEKLLSEAGGPLETETPPPDAEEAASDQTDDTNQVAEEPVQELASDTTDETNQAAAEPVQELASDQTDETNQVAEEPVQELASDQTDETNQAAEEPVQELASDQDEEPAEDNLSAEVGNDTEEMTTALPDGPLWSSPASVEQPPEPPTPEPGVWKSDEESGEPTYDTVMISREDLEPRTEAGPEALDVPAAEPSAAVAEEIDTTSGDDRQAVQMADAEPEEEPEAPDVPAEEPSAAVVEEIDTTSGDDRQAAPVTDAEPEPEPEAPDVPAEEPSAAVAEEIDTTSGDDRQAVQMADAEPEPVPVSGTERGPQRDAVQPALRAERGPRRRFSESTAAGGPRGRFGEAYEAGEDSEPGDDWQAIQVADAEPEEESSSFPLAEGMAEPDDQPGERAPGWLATEVDDEPEYRDPDESVRLISLARLYRRQGDLDKAAGVYRDLLDAEPDNKVARRELGELCGDGLTEITDEDVIPSDARVEKAIQAASMETMADARRRKVAFLRSWLEHIRAQD